MDPIRALDEIASLLERERASRYKSQAFRAASRALAGLTEAQLDDVAALRRRQGIGESTLRVIVQARGGAVPDYLAELRALHGPPPLDAPFSAARRSAFPLRMVGRPDIDRPHGGRRA